MAMLGDHFCFRGGYSSAPMCWRKDKSDVLQRELEWDGRFPDTKLASVCSFILYFNTIWLD